MWVHYITEQDIVLAEGAGTYQFDGNTYTEILNVVYPSGSGQIGTVLPFDCQVNDDGAWEHKGYIKMIQTDEESGETTTDSARIDEIWTRFQPEM